MLTRLLDWLDSRTGFRRLLDRALNEPVPRGTGWSFTTGSVVTLLVVCQVATGLVLAMYYVPAPSLAYASVRFIMHELTWGWLVRGLHFWGASFLVTASAVHLCRAFLSGSYKAPREVTWMTGLVLLQLILALSLSGYLLPWDQKAYWATTVTINVVRATPVVGESLANILRGGPDLGALTLGRWFSAHVLLLPGALTAFIVAHIYLMRRHGISGPIVPRRGPSAAFFPWHVMKDSVMMGLVFASLLAVSVLVPAPIDEIANQTDSVYVPRPEWYFLWMFQLLRYFPGVLEPVATIVVPVLVLGFLVFLPFLDRTPDRHPASPQRRRFTAALVILASGIVALTVLGLGDRPPARDPNDWGPLALAGLQLSGQDSQCGRCHEPGGIAAPLNDTHLTKDEEWLLSHMADPIVLAPGVRSIVDTSPAALTRPQAQSIVTYMRRLQSGDRPPRLTDESRLALSIFANRCSVCHRIAGEGGSVGPDLTHVGARRDIAHIRAVIENASMVYGESVMPSFKGRLTSDQIEALANYLVARR